MNPSLPPPLVCFRIHTQRHAQLKSFATKFPKVTRFCRPDVLRNYGVVWLNVMVGALRCQLEKSHISTHLQIKRKGSGSQNVLQVLGQRRKLAFKWRKWVNDSAWCPEWKTTSQTQARLLNVLTQMTSQIRLKMLGKNWFSQRGWCREYLSLQLNKR